AVVELDGEFYWLGEDRFYIYNGGVQELPNTYSKNFLYKNLTYSARMTSYAYTLPQWGEVWFCVPLFGAPVPNRALIYNQILKVWYDSPWPEAGRSCAYSPAVFSYPLLMGNVPGSGDKYELWQHEAQTYNKLVGAQALAIRAYCVRPDVSYAANGPGDEWPHM